MAALDLVPANYKDATSTEIKKYFEKAFPENSNEENLLLTAHYILQQSSDVVNFGHLQANFSKYKELLNLTRKYQELDLNHQVWPYLEIAFAGKINGKTVTEIS